jgi:ribosomal protein S18 acetylase RimI-like enzyme
MDLTLRTAVPDDYAAVNDLATEIVGQPADRRAVFTAALAHPDRALLVAEVAGEVAGFADILVYPDVTEGAMGAELMGLAVRTDHRRRGIGRALLDEACRIAAARGVVEFHICTEQDNEAAQRLYAARGAEVVGVQMEVEVGTAGEESTSRGVEES